MPISVHHRNPNCSNPYHGDNIKHTYQQHRYPSFYFFKKLLPSSMLFRKRPRHHHHQHSFNHHHATGKTATTTAPSSSSSSPNIRRSASTNSKPLHVLVRVSSIRNASSMFFVNNKRKKRSSSSSSCVINSSNNVTNNRSNNKHPNNNAVSSALSSTSSSSESSSNVSFSAALSKKLKTSASTDLIASSSARPLSHGFGSRRSIVWQDMTTAAATATVTTTPHLLLPQRPFSADFTDTYNNLHSCCFMIMDDDLVSEQYEENLMDDDDDDDDDEDRHDNDGISGTGLEPSHTGTTTTAPTASTTSSSSALSSLDQQQSPSQENPLSSLPPPQQQSFRLLRRLSRFGSSPVPTTTTTTRKTPRRATSLLVSTPSIFFTTQQPKAPTTSTTTTTTATETATTADKHDGDKVLGRSLSLSNYYRRRFSSLIITNNNEFGNSMTRARSVFIRNKQERAVAIWKRSIAQLDLSAHPPSSSSSLPIILPVADANTTNGSTSSMNSSKNEAIRAFILNELYATETSYHRLLDLISTKYMQPMVAAMRNRDPLLVKKSGDIPILFGHLAQLLKVSQGLIDMLDQQVHVAQVFMSLQEELTIFLRYAVHYKTYFKTIRRACQTNALLLSIERECLARRDTNRMGMSDYLIAPIQRVPRYCLLLQDFLKHTDTTDPSYSELYTASKMMTTLASVMNINDV